MADWFPIPDVAVDPDAPITSELGYAFRDNPIAIAEGAPGAPRIDWLARKHGIIGSGGSTGTNVTTFTGLSSVQRLRVYASVNQNTSGTYVQVAFSSNGGSSWGSYLNLFGTNFTAVTTVGIADFDKSVTSAIPYIASSFPGITVPNNFDAVRFRMNTGSVEYRVTIEALGAVE